MDKTGQRLRLNLSSHARSTIEADMSSFGAKESMGGFVSRIFESFASESRASIEAASRSYGESLEREVQLSRYRKAYPLDKTLEALQAVLPEADFFRANRQFIVARRAVKEIAVWFGSRLSLSLVLETPERIVISKARVPEFKAWLTSVQPAE